MEPRLRRRFHIWHTLSREIAFLQPKSAPALALGLISLPRSLRHWRDSLGEETNSPSRNGVISRAAQTESIYAEVLNFRMFKIILVFLHLTFAENICILHGTFKTIERGIDSGINIRRIGLVIIRIRRRRRRKRKTALRLHSDLIREARNAFNEPKGLAIFTHTRSAMTHMAQITVTENFRHIEQFFKSSHAPIGTQLLKIKRLFEHQMILGIFTFAFSRRTDILQENVRTKFCALGETSAKTLLYLSEKIYGDGSIVSRWLFKKSTSAS